MDQPNTLHTEQVATITLQLRAILVDILEIDEDELEEDATFLSLGADSFTLMHLLNQVKSEMKISLSLRQLFEEHNTLETLAEHVVTVRPDVEAEDFVPAPRCPEHSDLSTPPQEASAAPDAGPDQIDAPKEAASAQTAIADTSPASEPISPSQKSVDTRLVPRGDRFSASMKGDPASQPSAQFAASPGGTYQSTFEAAYLARTKTSSDMFAGSRSFFANNRILSAHQGPLSYPIIAKRLSGARFVDVDDNTYVDLAMGYGSAMFGHSPGFVEGALHRQIASGYSVGTENPVAYENAEMIAAITDQERVLFNNSGTEAVFTAVRIARAATGRKLVCVFQNAYHGHSDEMLTQPEMTDDGYGCVPMTIGIPDENQTNIRSLPYGSKKALEFIRAHGGDIAAVLVEPVQNRRPDIHPGAFLQELRALTAASGSALIFDEVLVGWRIRPGGAAEYFGVQPDIAAYGKVVGGGLPVGVVAGASKFMDIVDRPETLSKPERAYTAGTFCKHPLAMAAMNAVLNRMKSEGQAICSTLNDRTERFAAVVRDVFAEHRCKFSIHNFGSFFRFSYDANLSFVFQPRELESFSQHLVFNGVYVWEGGTCFISTAHTDADLDHIVRAIETSIIEMRNGGVID